MKSLTSYSLKEVELESVEPVLLIAQIQQHPGCCFTKPQGDGTVLTFNHNTNRFMKVFYYV